MSSRALLGLLTALLAALLFAAPASSAVAGRDAIAVTKTSLGAPSKQFDHASKRPRPSASVEQFFELDDDAEQDFTPLQLLASPALTSVPFKASSRSCYYRKARLSHRPCAFYSTGPPRA